jgi:uncharacterized membrane protein YeaQ/YmgE (transglycosylase-associated protein family)
MALFSQADFVSSGLITWAVVGLFVGMLAHRIIRTAGDRLGIGYVLMGDLVVGLIGSTLGGLLSGIILGDTYGFIGSIIVAFLGACLLIWLIWKIEHRRSKV